MAKFPVAQARCKGVLKSSLLTEIFMSSYVHFAKHKVKARMSPLKKNIN